MDDNLKNGCIVSFLLIVLPYLIAVFLAVFMCIAVANKWTL